MAAPVLATKLFVPPLRSDLVLRQRLIDQLSARGTAEAHAHLGSRRFWENHADQRMDRKLRATGRLVVAGRRG